MHKHMYIYKIVNIHNNKVYVGQHRTNTLDDGYMGSGKILRNAIQKYGVDSFRKDVIEVCDSPEALNEAEKKWIAHYNSTDPECGYNICPNAFGGIPPSAATRQKISEALRGRPAPWVREALTGLKRPPRTKEHSQKIRDGQTGRSWYYDPTSLKSKMIRDSDKIPSGWVKGRPPSHMSGTKSPEAIAHWKQTRKERETRPTEEQKQKISDGMKRVWAARKEKENGNTEKASNDTDD